MKKLFLVFAVLVSFAGMACTSGMKSLQHAGHIQFDVEKFEKDKYSVHFHSGKEMDEFLFSLKKTDDGIEATVSAKGVKSFVGIESAAGVVVKQAEVAGEVGKKIVDVAGDAISKIPGGF